MSTRDGGWTATLCPYCGVGCGLLVRVDDGRVSRVRGDPEHPANFGDICAKAVHLPPTLTRGRLLFLPLLRKGPSQIQVATSFSTSARWPPAQPLLSHLRLCQH